jgi:hypothetical protein
MRTGPDPIDFGVTPPHGGANATFTITRARSDALLTAHIIDDDSRGRFRVVSLKTAGQTSEPISTSGAMQPLKLTGGQTVEITVRFYSLGAESQDRFTATLLIRDASPDHPWQPIRARLVAQVAGVTTTLPGAVQLARGQATSVPVTVVLDGGPATSVSYRLQPRQDGISMTPTQVTLPRGGRATATLEFNAAADAPPGARDLVIAYSALDGRLAGELHLPMSGVGSGVDACQPLENLSAPWALDFPGTQTNLGTDNPLWSNWGITDSDTTFFGFLPTPKLFRPTNPYEVSAAIKQAEHVKQSIRALGSGWSFSDAVLPQSSAIPGFDEVLAIVLAEAGPDQVALRALSGSFSKYFGYAIDTTSLDRSLQVLLPQILDPIQKVQYFFFVEAGVTISFLNLLLDSQSPRVALRTMGGACAQTVAGAISTGTHGGDFDRPPLADSVRAIYLIGAGGTHHWIEPTRHITVAAKVQAVFPCILVENIHYDDDTFHAALVSMGAMGVIYAVILDVVPQYLLLQWNHWSTWEQLIADAWWGPSTEYDTGNLNAVALDQRGNAVEVHVGTNRLFYRVGTVDFVSQAIVWGPSSEYDTGNLAAVVLDDNGNTVEVHVGSNRLFYRVGKVDFANRAIVWGPSSEYDTGSLAAVALDVNGNAVEVHVGTDRLFYRVGKVDFAGKTIAWGQSTEYDTGNAAAVALDERGNVVETHVGSGRLFYRVGIANFANRTIAWGASTEFDTGNATAVTLDNRGNAVELHVGTERLFYRVGTVNFANRTIAWAQSNYHDTGNAAAIGLDDNGNTVEVHVGSGRLFYRVGRLALAGSTLAGLFDGTISGLAGYLHDHPRDHSPNRYVQVVVNPIRNRNGTHNCYISNRVELPIQNAIGGVSPVLDYSAISESDINNAIQNSPEFGTTEAIHFEWANLNGDFDGSTQIERLTKLLNFCKGENYPWAIRAVIDVFMQKSFPLAGNPPNPQVDVGYKVMAGGGTTRSFPTLGGTSIESAFSFYATLGNGDGGPPPVTVPDVITYANAALAEFDRGVESMRVFPAGWFSLRVCGKSSALLGMERFDRNGMVEVSLIGNPDDYGVVQRLEQITRNQGGALHWGQSNGFMTLTDLEFAYGKARLDIWRAKQQALGGDTFTNLFMKRCGLA